MARLSWDRGFGARFLCVLWNKTVANPGFLKGGG